MPTLDKLDYAQLLARMIAELKIWTATRPRSITNTDGCASLDSDRGFMQRMKDKIAGVRYRDERVWGWINENDERICKEYSERDFFAFDLAPHVRYLQTYTASLLFTLANRLKRRARVDTTV